MIRFIETPVEKTPKIFIHGSDKTELYVRSSKGKSPCSSEFKEGEVKLTNTRSTKPKTELQVHRNCKVFEKTN